MVTMRRRRLEATGDVEKLDQMFEMNAARAMIFGLVVDLAEGDSWNV
jgi:hypothetical protein